MNSAALSVLVLLLFIRTTTHIDNYIIETLCLDDKQAITPFVHLHAI